MPLFRSVRVPPVPGCTGVVILEERMSLVVTKPAAVALAATARSRARALVPWIEGPDRLAVPS
jgi:hypothetical protein